MPISRHARITRRAISPRLATRMRWNIVRLATGLGPGHVVGSLLVFGGPPFKECGLPKEAVFINSRSPAGAWERRRSRDEPPWITSLWGLTGTDAEQGLPEFDRIAVLHQDLDDCSADLGRNLIEHLHRLDDADDGFGRNSRPDRYEGVVVGGGGGIKRSHRGTIDRDGAIGRARRG